MDKFLLLRFLREEATPAEQAELEAWAAEDPSHEALLEDLQDPDKVAEALVKLDQLHREEAWQRVEAYSATHRPPAAQKLAAGPVRLEPQKHAGLYRNWKRYAAAAAVIALVGTGAWWIAERKSVPTPSIAATNQLTNDVLPGGNKAILTLSSGQKLVLDSATEDTTLTEGASIVAGAKGILAYNPGTAPVALVTYNTLTTPRGGIYQLTLPDGSTVWLNASSSITFPTAFAGKDRSVSITGEAYFEVAKNAAQPFYVTINKNEEKVNVLGTSFNINAYEDEPVIETTLLEGAVDVSYQNVGALLNPGMQATAYRLPNPGNQRPALKVGPGDTEQAVAWKNGRFSFTDADVPTVMRQLARWYNVDVSYEGNIPKRAFNGKIGKTLTLDQVLKGLTQARIHYTISGNQLTIRP